MSLKRIAEQYCLPPLKYGMKVKMDGQNGKIIGYCRSTPYLRVLFSNGTKGFVHPTWAMEYMVGGKYEPARQ